MVGVKMSRDSYAQYLIRKEEEKRLEEERLRKLKEERRRQEEIQKIKAQLRRREEINREKERLALIDKLQTLGATLGQKKPTPVADILPSALDRDVSARMREMVRAITVQLETLEEELDLVFAPQLEVMRQRIKEIKADNYDPFYYQSLQWLERDLNKLRAGAARALKKLYEEAEEEREGIDELLIQLRVIKKRSILDSQGERAGDLIAVLETLAREGNPRKIVTDLPQIHKEVQDLWRDFNDVETRDIRRSYVLQNVREVLEAMGYQALDGVDGGEDTPHRGPAPLSLLFRAPESGAVELTCGLDNSLHAEFVNIRGPDDIPIERQEATVDQRYQCEKWCQDYDRLQNELAQRDILIQEYWRIEPTGEDHREVLVPAEFSTGAEDMVPPPLITKEGGDPNA